MSKKEKALYIVIALFFIWLFASYVNVIAHNSTDCQYAGWNAFRILLKVVKGV